MPLVLELGKGECLWIAGQSPILFYTKTRMALTGEERMAFLFGKQIMPEEEATTYPKFLYYAIQMAYVGPRSDVAHWEEQAAEQCALLDESYPEWMEAVREKLLAREYYPALRIVNGLIKFDQQSESE